MANSEKKEKMLKKYEIKDMRDWNGAKADLIITDPPFGIEFSGKNSNYNRKVENVVDGYVEWKVEEYANQIRDLLKCVRVNLNQGGAALVFSGWNNSNVIQNEINNFKNLTLQGKLYWIYNFAPYCKKRPAHNIYEIFWLTGDEDWFYNNECKTSHCRSGERNLTSLFFKKDYKKDMPKYPTRLPFKLLKCLMEHFSKEGNLVFDPLAGSGMVGIVAESLKRDFRLGDLNENGPEVFEALIDYYYEQNNASLFKNEG